MLNRIRRSDPITAIFADPPQLTQARIGLARQLQHQELERSRPFSRRQGVVRSKRRMEQTLAVSLGRGAVVGGPRVESDGRLGMPLSQVPAGTRVSIASLPTHPGLQRRLLSMGVRPGVEVEVLRRGKPGGLLHLSSGLLEFMLRPEHAAEMDVHVIAPH